MDGYTGSSRPEVQSKKVKKSLLCCILLLAIAGCMWAKAAVYKDGLGLEKVEKATELLNCDLREEHIGKFIEFQTQVEEIEDEGRRHNRRLEWEEFVVIDAWDEEVTITTQEKNKAYAFLYLKKRPYPYSEIRDKIFVDSGLCPPEKREKCITDAWTYLLDVEKKSPAKKIRSAEQNLRRECYDTGLFDADLKKEIKRHKHGLVLRRKYGVVEGEEKYETRFKEKFRRMQSRESFKRIVCLSDYWVILKVPQLEKFQSKYRIWRRECLGAGAFERGMREKLAGYAYGTRRGAEQYEKKYGEKFTKLQTRESLKTYVLA